MARPKRAAAQKAEASLNNGDGSDRDGSDNDVFRPGADDEEEEDFEHQSPRKRRVQATPSPVKRRIERVDKSARRKANRTILDQSMGLQSEDEDEIELAERIIEASRGGPTLFSELADNGENDVLLGITDERVISNVGARIREEDRALFLDSSEGYFDQHKVRSRASVNTMSKAPIIDHSVFFKYTNQANELFHHEEKSMLQSAYKGMFSQWVFELSEGFSLLFYGLGSKRELLTDFVCSKIDPDIPIMAINGYNGSVQFKEILNNVADILLDGLVDADSRKRMPKDVNMLLKILVDTMEEQEDRSVKLAVLCHNIDGESLRIDKTSTWMAQLMSIRQIWFVASVDHIMAPLIWDSAKLASYNFVWHDVTTFAPYTVETSFDDPLLLGKKSEASGAKGVKYVLESVTPNHRALFRNLIYCQLEELHNAAEKRKLGDDEAGAMVGNNSLSVDYDKVLTECLNELTVSNKKDFHEKLKEFMDHKMVVSFDDSMGTKKLYIPFSKDVIQQILDDYLE